MRNPKFLLAIILLAIAAVTPFPHVYSSTLTLTVSTDKPSYLIGANITVYGNLTYNGSPVQDWSVALEVQDPYHTPVVTRTLQTDTNGKYNLTFKLSSDARLGTYTVYVSSSYKGETATNNTIFELYVPSTRYPWSMFRHNLRHTGYTESPAPNTNQIRWSYTTGAGVFSSPAVAYGKVYVGSQVDGKVYCLDASTGAHIWNYTTGDWVESSPAVAYGKVYIGSHDGKVYCLDAETGASIWNYTTGAGVFSSPAVADGKVYVGSWDNKVYCLDASTGAHIWNYTTGDRVQSSPAVAYGKVYIGSHDGKVYCLDASTGAHIWNYTTGGYVDSSPAVADGKVYVGSFDGKVYCLDASTGAHIWNYTTVVGFVFSSPAVADGKVYVGSFDGKVYCLDASTGAHIWNYTTGGYVHSSPAVADGMVFVGSCDTKVYALNEANGAFVWSYTTGNSVYSSPAVADGMVFVGSHDGKVYAFGNIVRVPEDYPTIPEAIEVATPGATIIIAPGTHHEPLVINKPLTILGKTGSATEFEGGGSGIAVTLLPSASGSTVAGVVITNWDQGIHILDASDCKIYDNIMSLMDDSGIVLEGNNALNNSIYSNIFQDNTIAINLTASSTSNTIYKNIISSSDIGLKLESDGNTIYANTISENEVGINVSNSNGNIIYHNNFINNTNQIESTNSVNIWDNDYPSGGNYWSNHELVDEFSGPNQDQPGSDGIVDTQYTIAVNNIDRYPLMKPFNPHDVGITNVITSKTIVGQGYTLHIDLKILNYGIYTENFNVTVYANTTIIATQAVTQTCGNSTTITLTWNTTGVAKGNYTITAKATPVPGETDTTDNTLADGWVVVTIPGDVDGDFDVDLYDAVKLLYCYGVKKGDPHYNPNLDINGNGQIFLYDAVILLTRYGQKDP